MPFHVEIGRGRRTAREFNVDAERLRQLVLEPWTENREVRMGDRDWLPAECRLTILEGPELGAHDLQYGRGWDRAERAGRNVTRELLASAARAVSSIAVLAETGPGRDAIVSALGDLGVKGVDWTESRESVLASVRGSAGGQPGAAPSGVILGVESGSPRAEWLYEAGLAVGALAGRALVVRLGPGEMPPALTELPGLKPDGELSKALAVRLEQLL